MPSMSVLEKTFCRSAPWQYFAGRVVVPWALNGAALSGDVLEIGAGSGAMAEVVTKQFPDAQFTVTDIDPTMVRAAAKRLRDVANVQVQEADVTALPFADGSFDHVTSYLMLHHVIHWPAALAEARRVLRPGGTFQGYDLKRSRPAVAIHVLDRSPYQLLSPRELHAGLLDAGFGVVALDKAMGGYAMQFSAQASGEPVLPTGPETAD